ncbi:MAG: hypothetical protein PHY08_01415 [Candidatus Cloacimonetes bacterium]|nr:hypothetical protein [Candidatus Cloacimonadota bacterium]MDD4155206.1 hypothetical protein [Candidatus Cloacimonadota bacterium]
MKTIAFKLFTVFVFSVIFINPIMSQVNDLNVPDLCNGVIDQYSRNYLNTSMVARGNTGIAITDRINVAIYNPAAFRSNESHFAFQFIVKDVADEFNTYNTQARPRKEYHSPFAVSFFGIGFNSYNDFHTGISYALTRSIEYNSFLRSLYGTGIVDTYPTFKEHQFTITFAKKFGDLSFGANGNVVLQTFYDYRNEGKIDMIDLSEIKFIPQLGVLYEGGIVNVGASYKPKVKAKFREKYISFETINPTTINSGITFNAQKGLKFSFDVDYVLYSETSDYFDDQISYKFGIQKKFNAFEFKVGFMHIPSVYEGKYTINNYIDTENDAFHPNFYDEILDEGLFIDTTQNVLTFGTSINVLKNSILHLAYLTDISGNTDISQFSTSLEINFSALRKKR